MFAYVRSCLKTATAQPTSSNARKVRALTGTTSVTATLTVSTEVTKSGARSAPWSTRGVTRRCAYPRTSRAMVTWTAPISPMRLDAVSVSVSGFACIVICCLFVFCFFACVFACLFVSCFCC